MPSPYLISEEIEEEGRTAKIKVPYKITITDKGNYRFSKKNKDP